MPKDLAGGRTDPQIDVWTLICWRNGRWLPKRTCNPEQRNARILNEVKQITHNDLMTILKTIDQDFLKDTISGKYFQEYFFENCQDDEVAAYLKEVLAK